MAVSFPGCEPSLPRSHHRRFSGRSAVIWLVTCGRRRGAATQAEGRETPTRRSREISWEICGASVATGVVEDVGFAGDSGWARLDSNQRPTDYEASA
jgi:hypothetical protein